MFGGKFAIADGLRQFGINPDSVSVGGEFASAYSTEKLTPTHRARLLEGLQATYDRFTGIVAEGRKLPLQKVQEIARGRVWSGEDASKIGLVDKTGEAEGKMILQFRSSDFELLGWRQIDGTGAETRVQLADMKKNVSM